MPVVTALRPAKSPKMAPWSAAVPPPVFSMFSVPRSCLSLNEHVITLSLFAMIPLIVAFAYEPLLLPAPDAPVQLGVPSMLQPDGTTS